MVRNTAMTPAEEACVDAVNAVLKNGCGRFTECSFWPGQMLGPFAKSIWADADVIGPNRNGGDWLEVVKILAATAHQYPEEFDRVKDEMYVWRMLQYEG